MKPLEHVFSGLLMNRNLWDCLLVMICNTPTAILHDNIPECGPFSQLSVSSPPVYTLFRQHLQSNAAVTERALPDLMRSKPVRTL